MATKIDELKKNVAEAVYNYGKENDSCMDGMAEFLADALSINLDEAEGLLNQLRPITKARIVIEFETKYDEFSGFGENPVYEAELLRFIDEQFQDSYSEEDITILSSRMEPIK